MWGGWKWLLKVWSKLWFRLLRFPAKPFKPVYTDIESLNTPTWQSKFKPVSNHLHSEWEKGRRNLATGSINTLQTAPINEMLSFHFSRFCLSQSQGSRREREFCPLNLEVRDENEIFLSISQGSRWDRDIFFQVSCFEMGLRDEISYNSHENFRDREISLCSG